MFIYNITLNMETGVEEIAQAWIREEYIPRVMQDGMFHEYQLCKLKFLDQETPAYAIQFYCSDDLQKQSLLVMEDTPYLNWVNERWNLQVMPFASILDILEPAYLSFIHKN